VPSLRIIELYILDALGYLTAEESATLEAAAGKVGAALKSEASTWQGVVEDTLDLPAEPFRDIIRRDWAEFDCGEGTGRDCAEAFALRVTDSFVPD
jgi:hypothetical protein